MFGLLPTNCGVLFMSSRCSSTLEDDMSSILELQMLSKLVYLADEFVDFIKIKNMNYHEGNLDLTLELCDDAIEKDIVDKIDV